MTERNIDFEYFNKYVDNKFSTVNYSGCLHFGGKVVGGKENIIKLC